jgi:hypothetical protein
LIDKTSSIYLYVKLKALASWNDFNFKIINFPNMCSDIPAAPAYGVYISQLIRYARKRHLHLRNRLLNQGYEKSRLIRSLKKYIFRYQDIVEIYSVWVESDFKAPNLPFSLRLKCSGFHYNSIYNNTGTK